MVIVLWEYPEGTEWESTTVERYNWFIEWIINISLIKHQLDIVIGESKIIIIMDGCIGE